MRVADFNGAQVPTESALSKDNSSRVNQTDGTDVLRSEGKVDQLKHDSELQQSMSSEYDGVLYCELEKRNGQPTESSVAEGKMIVIEEP